MEGGFKMKCPKCGSSECSIILEGRIIVPKIPTKTPENRLQCDDCGFEWK